MTSRWHQNVVVIPPEPRPRKFGIRVLRAKYDPPTASSLIPGAHKGSRESGWWEARASII